MEKDAYILTENMSESTGKQFVLNSRKYNESLEDKLVNWVVKNFNINDKICISGLAFKGVPDTSDLRGSSSISIVKKLNKLGYLPNLHDYIAYEKDIVDQIKGNYFFKFEDAVENCKALIILNNNIRYSKLDLRVLLTHMRKEKIFILDFWSAMNNSSLNLYNNIIYKNAGNILIDLWKNQ